MDNVKYEDPVVEQEPMTDDEDGQPMTEEEIEREGARLIRDAIDYNKANLAPHREQATDMYFGRPFGDEEEGRSQYVSTDVKDTVDALLPSFMRLFFGPDKVCEFEPRKAEDVPFAKMATDYINYIILQDNNGVVEIHNAIKDAMLRRQGVVKWWWEDITDIEEHHFEGLTEDQVLLLQADPRIEYKITNKYQYLNPVELSEYTRMQQMYNEAISSGASLEGVQPPPIPQPVEYFDVDVQYRNDEGRARFAAVPPEEWIFSSDGRSMADATLVGQYQDKTISDLRVMGVDEDIIVEVSGTSNSNTGSTELTSVPEAIKRRPGETMETGDASGPNRKIPYYEIYVYMDVDGDGVTEHRKQVYIGTNPKLVWDEPAPERPFAIFEIDPEPHSMVGMDVADRAMDIQLTKSHVVRGSLDSLSFSLHPRTVIVEGQASIADVMNTEIGAVIRERLPNMVRPLEHAFVGQHALPFLEYFESQKENRFGVSRAAAGLDPDALQSSTKAAVAATVSGAQQRLELYARMLAETGMKQLMRGLLRLVVENQNTPRMMRLHQEYVAVDPRGWDATMEVDINVAIGYTAVEERIAALMAVASRQEQVIATMGPGNPFVSFGQYSQTLHKLTELSGFKDTTQFWQKLPLDFNPPQPPPKPSPEELLAQAQVEKVRADNERAERELELKRQDIMLREDRERDRIEADAFLRAKEIELKYATKLNENELKAQLQRKRSETSGS